MTDLERQIAELLDAPCGCVAWQHALAWDKRAVLKPKDCSDCLPKRIAAAIAVADSAVREITHWRDCYRDPDAFADWAVCQVEADLLDRVLDLLRRNCGTTLDALKGEA